jgi:hypothetical protein
MDMKKGKVTAFRVETPNGEVYESSFEEFDDEQMEAARELCEQVYNLNYFKFNNVEKGETYYFPNNLIANSVVTLVTKEAE